MVAAVMIQHVTLRVSQVNKPNLNVSTLQKDFKMVKRDPAPASLPDVSAQAEKREKRTQLHTARLLISKETKYTN